MLRLKSRTPYRSMTYFSTATSTSGDSRYSYLVRFIRSVSTGAPLVPERCVVCKRALCSKRPAHDVIPSSPRIPVSTRNHENLEYQPIHHHPAFAFAELRFRVLYCTGFARGPRRCTERSWFLLTEAASRERCCDGSRLKRPGGGRAGGGRGDSGGGRWRGWGPRTGG